MNQIKKLIKQTPHFLCIVFCGLCVVLTSGCTDDQTIASVKPKSHGAGGGGSSRPQISFHRFPPGQRRPIKIQEPPQFFPRHVSPRRGHAHRFIERLEESAQKQPDGVVSHIVVGFDYSLSVRSFLDEMRRSSQEIVDLLNQYSRKRKKFEVTIVKFGVPYAEQIVASRISDFSRLIGVFNDLVDHYYEGHQVGRRDDVGHTTMTLEPGEGYYYFLYKVLREGLVTQPHDKVFALTDELPVSFAALYPHRSVDGFFEQDLQFPNELYDPAELKSLSESHFIKKRITISRGASCGGGKGAAMAWIDNSPPLKSKYRSMINDNSQVLYVGWAFMAWIERELAKTGVEINTIVYGTDENNKTVRYFYKRLKDHFRPYVRSLFAPK